MTRPTIVRVSRDSSGIVYEGDTPAPQKAEPPAPKPIKVRSRRAAERLGWRVSGQKSELKKVGVSESGTEFYERRPERWSAEWVGSFRSGTPQAYRQYATSLEGLLSAIESFEQRKAGAR